jgi:hypothetical protein
MAKRSLKISCKPACEAIPDFAIVVIKGCSVGASLEGDIEFGISPRM